MPLIKPPSREVDFPIHHEEEAPKPKKLLPSVYARIKAIAEMEPILCCGVKNHPLNKGCYKCKKPLSQLL